MLINIRMKMQPVQVDPEPKAASVMYCLLTNQPRKQGRTMLLIQYRTAFFSDTSSYEGAPHSDAQFLPSPTFCVTFYPLMVKPAAIQSEVVLPDARLHTPATRSV